MGCRGALQSLSRTNRLSSSPDSSQRLGRRGWWQRSLCQDSRSLHAQGRQPRRRTSSVPSQGWPEPPLPTLQQSSRSGVLLVGRYPINSQTAEAVSFSFL